MLPRPLGVAAALALCAAGARAQDPASLASDAPRPARPARPAPLLAPVEIGQSDGFNALVFTPPLEGAPLLDPGRALLFVRWHTAQTRAGDLPEPYRYRATLREVRVQGAFGLAGLGAPVELRLGLSAAALTGSERYVAATFEDAAVVPAGWRESPSVRRGWLGLKLGVLDGVVPDLQIAVTGWLKFGVDGDEHLTDTDGTEGGGAVHATYAMRVGAEALGPPNLFVHAMVGGMLRKDQEALATRVRPSPGAVFGLAAVFRGDRWPFAVALQCRGQVNAWPELQHFGSDPVSIQLGLRGWLAEGLIYEAGVSMGIADDVSAAWAVELAAGMRF